MSLGDTIYWEITSLLENSVAKSTWLHCKMDQKEYDRICDYLATKRLPDLSKDLKDALRRKCKNFLMKDGLLHYRNGKKGLDLQVLNVNSLAKSIFDLEEHCINWGETEPGGGGGGGEGGGSDDTTMCWERKSQAEF